MTDYPSMPCVVVEVHGHDQIGMETYTLETYNKYHRQEIALDYTLLIRQHVLLNLTCYGSRCFLNWWARCSTLLVQVLMLQT